MANTLDPSRNFMGTHETRGSFEDILAAAKPELRAVCKSLRRLIIALHERHVEIVWPRQRIASFGTGPKKMSEHYAYIAVQGSYVNLGFYRGAILADPQRLPEGTGKNLRHIKIRDIAAAKKPAVAALLRQAIGERKQYAISLRKKEEESARRRK
jgi:hypothetical protein